MSTQTTEIVHKLNELIIDTETRVITLEHDALMNRDHVIGQEASMRRLECRNHLKRALGQLKAARNSIMSANSQEAA